MVFFGDLTLLDPNCLVQFIRTKNYKFAFIQAAIVVHSLSQQVRHGGPLRFFHEAKKSYEQKLLTDDYLRIIRSERTAEAFASLLLQYYTFPFATSDEFALYTFAVSIAVSLRSTAIAVFEVVHLCVGAKADYDVVMAEE